MKNDSKFKRFLSNDITLLVVSLLIAFVIWFVINANSQTESNVTISNIPIKIELSQDAVDEGMEVFTENELTASVEVSGNRITVGSLSAADIEVVAQQSNTIIAPGSYTLDLTAKKVGVKTNYNFASNVSPSNVTVFVDKRKEKEFAITDEIVYKVEEGYYANTSLSESVVTVSGPETEVSAVDKVVVQGTLEGTGNSSATSEFKLIFLDKEGNELNMHKSTLSSTSVSVSLAPLPILDVELKVETANAPDDHPKIRITPSKIKIAGEKSVLDEIEDGVVYIGTLNFANVTNKKNSFTYDITLPNGCKNLSDSTTAKVEIDCSDYETKTITLNSFSSSNIDLNKYSVVFTSTTVDVEVCGPADLIENINTAHIIGKVDFADKLEEEIKDSISLELPFTFEFTKAYKDCWVFGEYTAVVNVTKKQ